MATVIPALMACFVPVHLCQVVAKFDLSRPSSLGSRYVIDLEFEDYSPNLEDHQVTNSGLQNDLCCSKLTHWYALNVCLGSLPISFSARLVMEVL